MHRPLPAMVKLLLVREWRINQLNRNQVFRYRTILVVIGVLLSIFLVIILLVMLASDDPWWKNFRETIRDSAGFLTLIGALVTAGILIWTNRARMREAASADFRDQMQWAAEHVGNAEKPYEQLFAMLLINRYGEQPPKWLPSVDRTIATDLQEAVQKTLEVPEDSIVIPASVYNDTSPNTPASDGVHESDQEYNS